MRRPNPAKARLLAVLRERTPMMKKTLRELKTKARARAERPTFVWDSLVQSFATMGDGSRRNGVRPLSVQSPA